VYAVVPCHIRIWDMTWTVYLARCADGTLYTGITTDPERRVAEHNRGVGAGYTRGRLPVALVYSEPVPDRSGALRREYAIKQLTRVQKEALAASYCVSRSTPGIGLRGRSCPLDSPGSHGTAGQ
jgi:putative endonuclease